MESQADVGLNIGEFVRRGDVVVWPQGTAEPRTLVQALVDRRASIGRFAVLVGASITEILQPEQADYIDFFTLGGAVTNHRLTPHQQVVPAHISAIPGLISRRLLKVDVVLLKVAQHPVTGQLSVGPVADYVHEAVAVARHVIAEISDTAPFIHGDTIIERDSIDWMVQTSDPLIELPEHPPTPLGQAIAGHVVGLIPKHATLQLGYGSVPSAVVDALGACSGLGIHSGMISDAVMRQIETGVITNAYKVVDPGVTVTGAIFGTARLYKFVDDNHSVQVRRLTYLHDPALLAGLNRFVSINSAVEVDLTGQVNAEVMGDRHVGAVGGHCDFVRAAALSPEGRSVIALSSAAMNGAISRIVPRLSGGVVTTSRADVDTVVTEYGVAELRGVSLAQRARRLAAIAHPTARDGLERYISDRDSTGWF